MSSLHQESGARHAEILDNIPEELRRHRGVSHAGPIAAAKEKVPTIDLADLLCGPGQMRRIGERWTARCPLPDHDEKTPSFTVYPGDRGWYCYGCLRGGDVVDLARLAWSLGRADEAAGFLLLEFGHPLPERPGSWYARQQRQRPMRDKIEEARTEVLMRRLFRWVFEPMLAGIEDADERAEAARRMWTEVLPLAARLVEDGRRQA